MRWVGALAVVMCIGCAAPAPAVPPTSLPTVSPTATPVPVVLEQRTPTGEYFLGRRDAPVDVEMFGDFQCPACGQFARTIEPSFVQQYVDTGKVKFVWRDFAWIGDESFDAAQAARCAGKQGKFWAYHDYLFTHQHGENLGAFTQPNLDSFALAIGLDPAIFGACLSGREDLQAIKSAVNFGVNVGVDVTPAFLINGELRIGAPPLSRLSALMDYYLARAQR